MTRYEIGDDGRMVETPDPIAVPPGWSVIGQHGNTVAMAPGPTAAEMTGTSETERGEHDGSDRPGAGE